MDEQVTAVQASAGTIDFIIGVIFIAIFLLVAPHVNNFTDVSPGEELIIVLVLAYGTIWGVKEFFGGLGVLLKYLVQEYLKRKEKRAAFDPAA